MGPTARTSKKATEQNGKSTDVTKKVKGKKGKIDRTEEMNRAQVAAELAKMIMKDHEEEIERGN